MKSKNSLWKALGLGKQIRKVGFGKTLLYSHTKILNEDPSQMEFFTWLGEKLPTISPKPNLWGQLSQEGPSLDGGESPEITLLFSALEKLAYQCPLRTAIHLYWNYRGTWLCEIEKTTHQKFHVNLFLNPQSTSPTSVLKFHLDIELESIAFLERCRALANWLESHVIQQLNSPHLLHQFHIEPKRDSLSQPC